ncbi:hypothetical protein BSN85_36435 [Bradyrhizobium brasilense]|uniref:hypothetical protein n=1 Tax=Bradyrhizobium brasilense TaxID=1419277 RepID=UPI00097612A4|nr:hypothetical protein [Bradyrhizobium brasilense]OMH99544.1 hypothetical protein BSN85_36435 [Bradyrhizobium brasilense]
MAGHHPAVARVEHIQDDVNAMKPSVATFDQMHQQGIGSKKTLGLIWEVLFTLAGAADAIGVKLLELFWPPNTEIARRSR